MHSSDSLQNRARQVIEPLIPPDAKDRVERSVKQWNQIVREHIRNETALRLTDGDGRNSIQVKVVEGFPIPLARLIDDYGDSVLWRIIVGQPKIGGIVEGLEFLLRDWSAIASWEKLPAEAKYAQSDLEHSLEVARLLQKLAVAQDVRKQIQEIDSDILGIYKFPLGHPCQVELYWMPIAMVSAMLDVRIEDLTIVVLAHELSHGYTHIGRDIDGVQWSDAGFAHSHLNVVEGLAQFYTDAVVNRIASRTPGARDAYIELMNLQSAPYKAHLNWIKMDSKQRGESVRFAMVSARSQGRVSIELWNRLLNSSRTALRKRTGTGDPSQKEINLLDNSDGTDPRSE